MKTNTSKSTVFSKKLGGASLSNNYTIAQTILAYENIALFILLLSKCA